MSLVKLKNPKIYFNYQTTNSIIHAKKNAFQFIYILHKQVNINYQLKDKNEENEYLQNF
jgi:hypothetical protein